MYAQLATMYMTTLMNSTKMWFQIVNLAFKKIIHHPKLFRKKKHQYLKVTLSASKQLFKFNLKQITSIK